MIDNSIMPASFAVIQRLDDRHDNLLLALHWIEYTQEQILAPAEFQKRFHKLVVVPEKPDTR